MEDHQTYREKHMKYLEECLRAAPPVAPVSLYRDSQTRHVLALLSAFPPGTSLLDYGCGEMRLLQGIARQDDVRESIAYTGLDLQEPSKATRQVLREVDALHWSFTSPDAMRRDGVGEFDVAVLTNVIHEVSVLELAVIFEDIRRALKDDGVLILVDMSTLPEGEPGAVPFYKWDLSMLFEAFDDDCFETPSGIPIVAARVAASALYPFGQSRDRIAHTFRQKRELWAYAARYLEREWPGDGQDRVESPLHPPMDAASALGHVSLLAGHAHVRVLEEMSTRERLGAGDAALEDAISAAAVDVIRHFQANWDRKGQPVTYGEVCTVMGRKHEYQILARALEAMTPIGAPAFFWAIPKKGANLARVELQATLLFDTYEERYSEADIFEMKLGPLQSECHHDVYGVYWGQG